MESLSIVIERIIFGSGAFGVIIFLVKLYLDKIKNEKTVVAIVTETNTKVINLEGKFVDIKNDSKVMKKMLYDQNSRLTTVEVKQDYAKVDKSIEETKNMKLVRVLIVDDQKDVRNFMFNYMHKNLHEHSDYFSKILFDIDLADSYESAIKFLEEHQKSSSKYNCGIFDYKMPGKTGFDLWYYCKENNYFYENGKMKTICYSAEPKENLNNVPREISPHFIEFKKDLIQKPGGINGWVEFDEKLKNITV